MITILYIEDTRRPERNIKFKEQIGKLELDAEIEYCENIDPDYLLQKKVDGVVYHSGMDGYKVIYKVAKKLKWPRLSYSGAVSSTPYLCKNTMEENQYSVNREYFLHVLPEFIECCKVVKCSEKI
jgi:hypothetical protein